MKSFFVIHRGRVIYPLIIGMLVFLGFFLIQDKRQFTLASVAVPIVYEYGYDCVTNSAVINIEYNPKIEAYTIYACVWNPDNGDSPLECLGAVDTDNAYGNYGWFAYDGFAVRDLTKYARKRASLSEVPPLYVSLETDLAYITDDGSPLASPSNRNVSVNLAVQPEDFDEPNSITYRILEPLTNKICSIAI